MNTIPVKFKVKNNKIHYKINAEITDLETLNVISNAGEVRNGYGISLNDTEQQILNDGKQVTKLVSIYKLGYNRMDSLLGSPEISRKATDKERNEAKEVFIRLLASDNPEFYDPTYAGGKKDKGHGFWLQTGYNSIDEIKSKLGMGISTTGIVQIAN